MQKLCYINTSVTLLELFKSKAPTAVDADGEPTPPVIGMVGQSITHYKSNGATSGFGMCFAIGSQHRSVSGVPTKTRLECSFCNKEV